TACPKPTASITASISAARSSSVRTFGTGSDSPTPALSNRATRQNVPSCSANALNWGRVQASSIWLTNGPTTTSPIGPSPNTGYARLRSPHEAYDVSPTAIDGNRCGAPTTDFGAASVPPNRTLLDLAIIWQQPSAISIKRCGCSSLTYRQ